MEIIPQYFDVHSHLNFGKFDEDRKNILERLTEEHIWTTTIGTSLDTSKEAIALAENNSNLFAAIGIHPTHDEKFPEEFREVVQHPKVVAIGECGLDTFRFEGDIEEEKRRQKELFLRHIELSLETGKPLMIHARNSYAEIFDILSSYSKIYGERLKGDMHFFSGTVEEARKFLDIGFMISFAGPITFAKEYESVVRYVPLASLMAETDSPFAAPAPHRGKRNEPSYVKEVVKRIAEIKDISLEDAREATVSNALRFFGIN